MSSGKVALAILGCEWKLFLRIANQRGVKLSMAIDQNGWSVQDHSWDFLPEYKESSWLVSSTARSFFYVGQVDPEV